MIEHVDTENMDGRDVRQRQSELAALFQRCISGDDAAAVEIFHRFHPLIYTYCTKIVKSREVGKDLAQDVWKRVLELRRAPMRVDNPLGFLMRIARNLCLNHLRDRQRETPIPSTGLPDSLHPKTVTPSHAEEIVLAALDELPAKYREILTLNIYCGYRYDEIAVMLDTTPEAIWQRASRARKELRLRVAELLNEHKRF